MMFGFPLCLLICISQLSTGLAAVVNHRSVQVDKDIYLHVREHASGSEDNDKQNKTAPVVLMLHGFPDLSLTWQYQAKRLADEGYFVVAPDLRGYGNSTIPSGGVAAFGQDQLMSDLVQLRKHYCGEEEDASFAMIVGHDVGGSLTWIALETIGPTPIAKSAIILNAPHPETFFKVLKRNPIQLLQSWYVGFMQLPLLPEFIYSRMRMLCLCYVKQPHSQLTKTMLSIAPAEDQAIVLEQMNAELEEYKRNVNDCSRVKAMIAYYRAMAAGLYWNKGRPNLMHRMLRAVHGIRKIPSLTVVKDTCSGPSITVPTKVIWGQKDKYLRKCMAYPPKGRIETLAGPVFLDAGHWVHWEKPVETADMLVEFANKYNNK